jgi:hypothetical protein
MKKLFALFLLVLLVAPSALGLSVSNSPLVGQDQNYYVVFDQEGEASVIAQLDINDLDNDQLIIEIPGVNVELISVMQQYYKYDEERGYRIGSPIYVDADFGRVISCTQDTYCDESTTTYEINVPRPDEKDVAILLYYKSESYVNQKGGTFKYDFETISSKLDTGNVRVSISVAEDLYLKGVDSGINYNSGSSNSVVIAEESLAAIAPSSYYYRDTSNSYSKSAQALDPFETFHVEGKYSKSWWTMNWWQPMLGILIAFGLVIGGIVSTQNLFRRKKNLRLSIGTGLLSGTLLAGSWLGVGYLLVDGMFRYSGIELLLILISLMVSLGLFVSPALLVGFKEKKVKFGIYTFVTTLLTSIVLLVLGLVAYFIFI